MGKYKIKIIPSFRNGMRNGFQNKKKKEKKTQNITEWGWGQEGHLDKNHQKSIY